MQISSQFGSKRHNLQAVELSQTGVQIVSNLPAPSNGGTDLPFFGQAGEADPLDGWRCFSQKRRMSRPIQVRQHHTKESGSVISAIHIRKRTQQKKRDKSHHNTGQHKRNKTTRGAQTAYSRHTCRHHHNSGNQTRP